MKLLGYRHVTVLNESMEQTEDYRCGVLKSGDSWLESWKKSGDMPEMMMLQLIVDDADEFAQYAKSKGVELQGPMIENGGKIYSMTAPNRMPVTIQSSTGQVI